MMAKLLAAIVVLTLAAQPAPTAADASVVVAGATASVYLVINNPTMYDIYVVSAASPAAGKVELYSGDKPASDLTVPSYGALELKAGESITVTMMTDGGVSIVAVAAVK